MTKSRDPIADQPFRPRRAGLAIPVLAALAALPAGSARADQGEVSTEAGPGQAPPGSSGLQRLWNNLERRWQTPAPGIASQLAQRVLGQPDAVAAVAASLEASRSGLVERDGPAGTFLFVGPPETGKTTMARAIAEIYHGSADRLVRFDLARYERDPRMPAAPELASAVENDLRRLIGGDTRKVLLLENLEAAPGQALAVIESMLRTGEIAGGKPLRLRNTVIAVRASVLPGKRRAPMGFQIPGDDSGAPPDPLEALYAAAGAYTQSMPASLRHDLQVVPFAPLTPQTVAELMSRRIADLGKRLQRNGVTLAMTREGMAQVFNDGFRWTHAISALTRSIETNLSQPLATAMQSKRIPPNSRVVFHCQAAQCVLATQQKPSVLSRARSTLTPWLGALRRDGSGKKLIGANPTPGRSQPGHLAPGGSPRRR